METQENSLPAAADGCVSHKVNLFSKDISLRFTAAIFQSAQRKQSGFTVIFRQKKN